MRRPIEANSAGIPDVGRTEKDILSELEHKLEGNPDRLSALEDWIGLLDRVKIYRENTSPLGVEVLDGIDVEKLNMGLVVNKVDTILDKRLTSKHYSLASAHVQHASWLLQSTDSTGRSGRETGKFLMELVGKIKYPGQNITVI